MSFLVLMLIGGFLGFIIGLSISNKQSKLDNALFFSFLGAIIFPVIIYAVNVIFRAFIFLSLFEIFIITIILIILLIYSFRQSKMK